MAGQVETARLLDEALLQQAADAGRGVHAAHLFDEGAGDGLVVGDDRQRLHGRRAERHRAPGVQQTADAVGPLSLGRQLPAGVQMEQAEAGDGDALRALIVLGIPKQKPVSLPSALPGGPDGVLAALEAGTIAPDEAKVVMDVHLGRAKIREVEELEQRLAALERAVQEKGSER